MKREDHEPQEFCEIFKDDSTDLPSTSKQLDGMFKLYKFQTLLL